jgi:hypothetical protein
MKTTVNKDGSITTSIDDEAPVAESPAESESEAKVVKAPAKPAAKARSTAEGK